MYVRILFSPFGELTMIITETHKFGDLLAQGGFGLKKDENKEVIIKEKRN